MTDLAQRFADSYRTRLAIGYVLIVAIFAVAWAWSLFGPLTDEIVSRQQEHLLAVARSAAIALDDAGTTPDELTRRLAEESDLRMTLVAADGRVIADSSRDPGTMEPHADRPEVAAALQGRTGTDRRISSTEGNEQLFVAVPATFESEEVAVRIAQPLATIGEMARASRRTGLAFLSVALLMAIFIAMRMSTTAAEPVQRLSRAAEQMAKGDLGASVPEVGGELAALAGALGDLKLQMRARLAELEGEQRTLRGVLDGLSDAVLLVQGDSIRYANRSASQMFKTPATGWKDRLLDESGLPSSLLAHLTGCLEADEPSSAELEPDPTGRSLRVSVIPLNPDAAGPRAVAVISDVTERARVDAIRRDFVANASHELKTPVAGIALLADAAREAADDGDVDQALRFNGQIAAEAARLKRLVADLLDLSRLESLPAEGLVTDVRSAIENAVVSHRAAAVEGGLSLVVDDTHVAGIDLYATADPTDVAIALDNLLDNAIAYTEAGSVTVAVSADPTSVHIAVTDTGVGIPAEDLPRVFERFYRIDRARSRDSGGTGLGLALVRHVMERSGGSVEVSSVIGKGSTFTLHLPRAT